MKTTKVNSTRVAVLRRKTNGSRAVLYAASPNKSFKDGTMEAIITKRVESANRLYGVFFRGEGKRDRELENLEKGFTWLMMSMESKFRNDILKVYKSGGPEKIQRCIEKEIAWMMEISRIEKLEWNFKNKQYESNEKNRFEFSHLKTDKLTEEALEDAIVRTRKYLKRGTNKRIIKRMLKAVAEGNRTVFVNALDDMRQNDGMALYKYIDAVNRDYYKTNLLKSLLRHDVKVQANDKLLDLASVNNEKGDKGALTTIMERYASSKDGAVETLLELKRVLFDYFFDFGTETYGSFFMKENLWKIPDETVKNDVLFGGLFDEGFQAAEEYAEAEKRIAADTLEVLFRADRVNWGKINGRVKFVNYGKYLRMLSVTENEVEKFWINYVKEYVEKNYNRKKNSKKTWKNAEAYTRNRMFKECWKDAIRYLCGKYIDLGKAVYHFAMPEDMSPKKPEGIEYGILQPQYQNGISSFDYEVIKAEETLQRNIANMTVAALSSFSRAVIDSEKLKEERQETNAGNEDILFIAEETLLKIKKENTLKQILRYYGGQSEVKAFDLQEDALIKEIKEHFALIRNENFHYTAGKIKDIGYENTLKLWENDVRIYAQVIRQKYYSNNAAMFYDEKVITELVQNLYQKKKMNVLMIPAFRSVWKRNELPAFVNSIAKKGKVQWIEEQEVRTKYEGALYFLLKEIYYNDFVHKEEYALALFITAIDNQIKSAEGSQASGTGMNHNSGAGKFQKTKLDPKAKATADFKAFVDNLKVQKLSFAQVCQAIQQEYNQQNANAGKEGETEIYEHFKMLLPICLKSAFQAYLREHYKFLFAPVYKSDLKGEPEYLDQVAIDCGVTINGKVDKDVEKRRLAWYSFAHFVHPRQLNFLIGDFKSYIQYREDVLKRAKYAKQYQNDQEITKAEEEVKNKVEHARSILEILEFIRPIAGRVSNEFEDYYESAEEYAVYLSHYIDFVKDGEPTFKKLVDFCKYTLENGQLVDIYADEINPKVLRNVEIARMYAGGDVVLNGIEKITAGKVQKYYQDKEKIAQLLSKGLCANEKEQKAVIAQQQLKGQLMLNDVTESFSLINDMLGQLVSLAYLRERDKMYLLLGYYYMALRNAANWNDEVLNVINQGNIQVKHGVVLYQVVGMFDFGTPFLRFSSGKNKWEVKTGVSIGMKEGYFAQMHADSMECALQLFEKRDGAYQEAVRQLRNYVDHFKYYVNFDKSITELYVEFFIKFFSYSKKLKNSVIFNFGNILEKYFLENEVEVIKNAEGVTINLIRNIKSQKFTYKLEKDPKSGRDNTCEGNAKSNTFVKAVREILTYKI